MTLVYSQVMREGAIWRQVAHALQHWQSSHLNVTAFNASASDPLFTVLWKWNWCLVFLDLWSAKSDCVSHLKLSVFGPEYCPSPGISCFDVLKLFQFIKVSIIFSCF